MKIIVRSIMCCFALLLITNVCVAAVTLSEVKDQGIIGEMPDGYLGFVSSSVSSEVEGLVKGVNAKRRRHYQKISRERGTSLASVEFIAGERNIEDTEEGHYYLNEKGKWVKK